jgi:hypothetical protein
MAIECGRCGGPAMPETVIKIRRGVLGRRGTRSQGGYCVACRLSVPLEPTAAVRPPVARARRPRRGFTVFLPQWLRVAPARPGGGGWG